MVLLKRGFLTIVVFFIILSGPSCHSNHKGDPKRKTTFFDSVASKMSLDFSQMQRHAQINSSYFTAKSKFTGDTIYYPHSAFPLIIVHNDDGQVCSYNFLLVYNGHTKVNTACHLVETDCDEDYSSDFHQLSFKIFNKAQFFTREVAYIRQSGKKTRVIVNDRFFQIDEKGKIDRLKSAPVGVNVPIFVQPDDIDDKADDSLNKNSEK